MTAPPVARSCPPTPQGESPEELGFTKQPMVDWLSPRQLAHTGIKALLSSIFGTYTDRREVQAALQQSRDCVDYTNRDEIWIDFVADLGDGFHATYSVARLLAAPTLSLDVGTIAHETRRGDILVMGGDQVYPTPSHDQYRDRTKGPYRAALPCVPGGQSPHLYAIPGNHDWYDGLTSFLRTFCQESWLGGWKMQQRRSYFAAKLPHGWWLWGIDVQLDSFVDRPQLDYFESVAKNHMQPDDKVILVTAQPSWVYSRLEGPSAFRTLAFFEDRIIRQRGRGRLALALSGDLHHYTRYQSEGPEPDAHRITAGGGGAYLSATHEAPARLDLEESPDQTRGYSLRSAYPSRADSLRLALGCLRLPWRSWRFGLFLGVLYSLYAWILQSASKMLDTLAAPSLMDELKELPFSPAEVGPALLACGEVLKHAPASVLFSFLILGGLIAFCAASRPLVRVVVGGAHAVAHILLNLFLMWGFARLNAYGWEAQIWGLGRRVGPQWPIDSVRQVIAFVVEMLACGLLLGGWLMALYLLSCSFLGHIHTGEVFSSQRIPDYKNFLRLHLDPQGRLRIYAVAVPRACRKWRLNPQAVDGQPWLEPQDGPIACHLIEPPIELS